MGKIAQHLIASFRQRAQNIKASPNFAHAVEQFTQGLPDDLPTTEELAEEGYDPQHILYIAAHNFSSVFAESVSELDEFEGYANTVTAAEDEYMPSSPPMSPITNSFFSTWALFDVRFGPDGETVGGCLAEVMREMDAPSDMLLALENYSRSRMGIYQHCGGRGREVRLRELVTGEELLCYSTSGYRGCENELWYVRLCPPLSEAFDYHVAVTTPHVLTAATAEDWTAFLHKQLFRADDKRRGLHDVLKYGNERVNWMEFVFQAYHHYQFDAIFLAGLPDVPASLPHSPVHDQIEEAVSSHGDEAIVNLKLTEVQRKTVAAMFPEFASRLRLAEKNQRVIPLLQSELERVVAAARAALPETKGSRRIALKKIIDLGEPARCSSSKSAATIYQFKITLADSDPPIWRRIQVEDCTLADFHYCVQGAMGWMDSHLHEFNIEGERYAVPPPLDIGPMDEDTIDASTVRLSELIGGRKKFRCRYLYDFGDSWEHLIELETIGAAEPQARYPRCTDGARACPPEDCGGIWAFYDFVAAMTDRKHPEHRELKEWHGGPFRPDAFDKQKASLEMRRWAK